MLHFFKADRAKAIKTTATINESPTDKLIRELREENQRLMEMLKSGGIVMPAPGAGGGVSNDGKYCLWRSVTKFYGLGFVDSVDSHQPH